MNEFIDVSISDKNDYAGPLRIGDETHITIDLTYSCNMACINCNRLSNVKNKPVANLTFKEIQKQVINWLEDDHNIKSISIAGGEPTAHPEFLKIIKFLAHYCKIVNAWLGLFTNGGKTFQKIKDKLPENITIINSAKTNNNPGHFIFTVAPIDLNAYDPNDNPCRESMHCGRTLNKNGYFVCPSAGAIDNFLKLNLGISGIKNATEDNLRERAKEICKYCGTYLREKRITGTLLGPHAEQEMSPFWKEKIKL